MSLWRRLARDSYVRLSAALLLASAVPYVAPLLSTDQLRWFAARIPATAVHLLAIAAFWACLRGAETKAERLFWKLWVGSFAIWLGLELMDIALLTASYSFATGAAQDLLYFVFFVLVAWALETKPHIGRNRGQGRSPRPLGPIGPLGPLGPLGPIVFVVGLLLYLLAIPAMLDRASYLSFVPSYLFYSLLDGFLALRLAFLRRTCASSRWRRVYSWLLLMVGVWMVTDGLNLFMTTGIVPYVDYGTPLDLLWLVYFPIAVLAARTWVVTGDEADEETDGESRPAVRDTFGHLSLDLSLILAMCFLIVHFAVMVAGSDKPEVSLARNIAAFGVLLALAAVALARQRILRAAYTQAQESRQHSESKYRSLFENVIDGVFQSSPDGRILSANRALVSMLGYSSEQELASADLAADVYVEPEERARASEMAERDGRVRNLELSLKRKDGGALTVLMNSRVVRDDEGHSLYYEGTLTDITERKQAEQQRQRLGRILDQSDNEIYVFSADTYRFTQVNQGARSNVGYSMDELREMKPWDLKREFDAESFAAHLEPLHRGDLSVLLFESSHRRKDGTSYPVEVRLQLMAQESPRVFVAILQDISERRAAEEALRESEARYRGLFENVVTGVFVSTPGGEVIAANPAMLEMLGYDSEEEFRQVDIARDVYVDPEDRARWMVRLEEEGEVRNREVTLKRKNGEEIIAITSLRAVRDDAGNVKRLEGTLTDVTEIKKLETQLLQSQRLEAVGVLAGGIAHDFNNLLTAIKGHAELALAKSEIGDSLHEDVEVIARAADRAAELTRKLLAFSRQQVLRAKVVDLNTVVESIEALLVSTLGEDIEFHKHLSPTLGRVKVDPGQIEQVLMNLTLNARDAMPAGGSLELRTANVELDETIGDGSVQVERGPYVMISATDTGEGMSEEVRRHAFEPFFTTKERDKGTGLGLAMVYGFVKQSGGYIWFESDPGQGTSCTVYLPRVEEEVESPQPSDAPAAALGGSRIILLVEDDRQVRTLLQRTLESGGYRVLAMESAEQALETSGRIEHVDLLVTDVVLPGLPGPDLARKIAQVYPHVKVLLISGYADERLRDRGLTEPGVPFLQKPFAPQDLLRSVEETLAFGPASQGSTTAGG